MQTAEFVVSQGIDHEPALNWLVMHELKKIDRMIDNVRKQKTRYLKKSHKFDIELPQIVKQFLALDAKSREMENVGVAFGFTRLEISTHRPPICVMPYII